MSSKTKLVGKINFNNQLIQKDLDYLASLPIIKEQYDEFSSGTWINQSLYNKSGKWDDTQYSDFDHPAIKTAHGTNTPYISEIIEQVFDTEHMRMARIRNLVDGLVIPHVDFLELSENKSAYVRILVPLETCLDSYHTEENFGIFRMRKGDIWILESQVPHSAYNLSSDNRRILSIDFQYKGEVNPDYRRIFKDKSIHNESFEPAMVQRVKLEKEDLDDYLHMLSRQFKNKFDAERILVKLSNLQIRYDSSVSDIYENLIQVAKLTKNEELITYATNMKRFYIGKRVMDERFILRENLLEA
jgi:Aspartyl/Asparaginyl beta-hydroxylase